MEISAVPAEKTDESSSAAAQETKNGQQPIPIDFGAGKNEAENSKEKSDGTFQTGVRGEKDDEKKPMEIDNVAGGKVKEDMKVSIVTEKKSAVSENPELNVRNAPAKEKKEAKENVANETETNSLTDDDLKQDAAMSEGQRVNETKLEDSKELTGNANGEQTVTQGPQKDDVTTPSEEKEEQKSNASAAEANIAGPEPKPSSQQSSTPTQPIQQQASQSPPQTKQSSQEESPQKQQSSQNPGTLGKSAQETATHTSEGQLQQKEPLKPPMKPKLPVIGKQQETQRPQEQAQQERKVKAEQTVQPAQQQAAKAQQLRQPQSAQQAQLPLTSKANVFRPKQVVKQVQQLAQRVPRPPPAAAQLTPQRPTMTAPPKIATATAQPTSTTGIAPSQIPPPPPALPSAIPQPSRALQVARLIMDFLGPNHPPPQNPQLPTLNALRTRLTTNPNYYDANLDHLAWQVREAIRTEFFKVLYPAPPPNSLLNLVTSTESILAPFPPRPFFFPGARVAVPTEAGSRRAATSLQLRFKQVGGTTVAEALLHLDGPHGGGFQWVQAPALTPLSLYAPPAARVVQKKPKKPRIAKPVRPRKRKEKVLPSPPPIPPKSAARSASASSPSPARALVPTPVPTQAAAPTKAATAAALARSTPPLPASTPASAPVSSSAPPPIPAPRMAGVVARLARQEASGVHVPDALRGTSPPPRARIVSDGRFVSHVSGAMRSATLDVDKMLGIERLVARRETDMVEYFVKWSGVPMKEGSWESREALLQDVPGLVRDFDVRHPERNRDRIARSKEIKRREVKEEKKEDDLSEAARAKNESTFSQDKERGQGLTRKASFSGEIVVSLLDGKKEVEGKEDVPTETRYTDDVTGLPIPSWLDTPIIDLNIAGMVLQIRRPSEAVLHNDATSAVRDARKRQTRFKQENILLGERLFPLTKPEAKSVIDAAAKDHRLYNRVPIPFPKGIGRVSPGDQGHPFGKEDVLRAPPSWEAYFLHLGMTPTDYSRSLPPYMPTLDDIAQSKILRAREDIAYATAFEHRERARLLLRESFRHTGAPPPEHIFRDGVRAPPESRVHAKRKRSLTGKISDGSSRGLLRAREPMVEAAIKKAKKVTNKEKSDAWFDEIWGCWRPAPSA